VNNMSNLHLVTGYAGKEHITSADQGSYNAAIMGNGEFILERGNQFAATIISNNQVRVSDGDIMMQGRHIRMIENTYTDLYFDNGTQGYKRNDLIVVRYEKDASTDIEIANLVVIKGTPSEASPATPEHVTGNIINEHALMNDLPLYIVPFDGINIQPLRCLFKTVPTIETKFADAMKKLEEAIQGFKDIDLLNTLEEIEANTLNDKFTGALAVKSLFDDFKAFKASFQVGCSKIAAAITSNGVSTAANASPAIMVNNINQIRKPDNGAVTASLNCGGSYTIPKGYHNGRGKVTANSLVSQTSANATASMILSGKTAWVNGSKITGNITSKAAATYTPATSNQTIAAGQYLSGVQTIKGDANLTAANILLGKSIFGINGTGVPNGYKKVASVNIELNMYVPKDSTRPMETCLNISGNLGFEPNMYFIFLEVNRGNGSGNAQSGEYWGYVMMMKIQSLYITPKIISFNQAAPYNDTSWKGIRTEYRKIPTIDKYSLCDFTNGNTTYSAYIKRAQIIGIV